MFISRSQIVDDLAAKAGFYKHHVKSLLEGFDELIKEYADQATDDEEVVIQLLKGIRISIKIMPERERQDPRNNTKIICAPTVKPQAFFSNKFRYEIQQQYEDKKDGET